MATEDELKLAVADIIAVEKALEEQEAQMMANEQFRQFLTFQKETTQKIRNFWEEVETQMIDADIKSIKGDWGTLTIAERLNWDTTDELPSKFYKKVVDTKRLSDTFRLEGKAPKGATPSYKKYLTKRIKGQELKGIVG